MESNDCKESTLNHLEDDIALSHFLCVLARILLLLFFALAILWFVRTNPVSLIVKATGIVPVQLRDILRHFRLSALILILPFLLLITFSVDIFTTTVAT